MKSSATCLVHASLPKVVILLRTLGSLKESDGMTEPMFLFRVIFVGNHCLTVFREARFVP